MSARPIVTVIVATYNSSHLLRHAMASVLASTLADWEMIVVGDCCTDDTEDVVAEVGDHRVTFVNLPANSGEQSAPNNLGVSLARGRYIAFLNQDDMYFPDHLARAVEELERTGADIVWVPCAAILPATPEDLADGRWQAELYGVPPTAMEDSGYSPLALYCASSWVLRREVCARVGPWRPHEELYVTPSQDWLFRASKAGADVRFFPHVSVLLIPSTRRRGSYARKQSPEHEYFATLIGDPEFRWRLVESAALNTARSSQYNLLQRPGASVRRTVMWPVWSVLDRLGVHPFAADLFLRVGGKGKQIRRVHRFAGVPVSPVNAGVADRDVSEAPSASSPAGVAASEEELLTPHRGSMSPRRSAR